MPINQFNINGLTQVAVLASRKEHGQNSVAYKQENVFWVSLKSLLKDPMILLLLVASVIYFINNKTADGIFLSTAIVLVAAISIYQESRSKNALEKLKDFTQPRCKVIRNGEIEEIKTQDLVLGDSLMVEEGAYIAADGVIVHSNDFSVNESVLTGESLTVDKDKTTEDNHIYQGTTVTRGLAIVTITAIGSKTRLGQIGKSLESIKEEKTPLEVQINDFVKKMAIVGGLVFLVVWGLNYYHSRQITDSLLKALTLAMSILPEEIPVTFTVFMALGAWRMMKKGIVVKQMKTVETLGSATVICTDKTGTITQNKMSLAKIFTLKTKQISDAASTANVAETDLIKIAMWASEPIAFDPMEIALHEAYSQIIKADERPNFKLIHEYPLSGKPPMMTHVFEDKSKNRIIAAKGAAEALIPVCKLSAAEKRQIEVTIKNLSADGYRILAVAEAHFEGNDFPKIQQEFSFDFKGILAFYDPPKPNIKLVLEKFYKAGVAIKIITGDNAATTTAIANLVGLRGINEHTAPMAITGDELMKLSDSDLKHAVANTQIFSRMFPDAKLKIIDALKANNEVVAMIGDGVNDGPALKSAHIGIAMGKKGTEIAKSTASLVLINDDLSKMILAVAMGRKIYANLKKAIQFVISIHIPIILTVFVPLAMGWRYPNIFSPVHIIFLELIMGPTCSIVYENEPIEKNTMTLAPRPFTTTFFNIRELSASIFQGLMMAVGTLLVYQYALQNAQDEPTTRAMVFTTLITANVFLTLVNRSFYYTIFTTIRYKNNLIWRIIGITIVITGMLLFIKPLSDFFEFERLSMVQLGISIGVGFISVIWIEPLKYLKRIRQPQQP
jgi:P-type Ca2+ transporter type 2C